MEIIYLYAIIASSFNGNLKYVKKRFPTRKLRVLDWKRKFPKEIIANWINCAPCSEIHLKNMFSKHRLGKWWQIILPQLCFDYVTPVDDSPILWLSIVKRVNCADLVMKIHFPFLRSLHLLTRPNIVVQLPSNWTVQGFKMISTNAASLRVV